MARYRKKPIEIEAVLYDGSLYCAGFIVGWADDAGAYLVRQGHEHALRREPEFDGSNGNILDSAQPYIVIPTLEGDHRADVGDYVIQGVQGEFYPCKPDIFAATYDAVGGEE